MRYSEADDVSFTDSYGETVNIKAILPVAGRATTFVTVDCESGTSLEEIASRENMYGTGSESLGYKIFDENIISIVEARFDLSKIKKLRVPM